MSGSHGTLKGLLGWVCGWPRAWRVGLGPTGCGLSGLCSGEPPSVSEVSGAWDGLGTGCVNQIGLLGVIHVS